VQAVVPGSNGGTTTFRYDPFGRRIQKSGPLGTTNYLYDWANLLQEVDQGGNLLARYVQGSNLDELLAEFRSATASYYEQDTDQSVSSLSNGAAALVTTYSYDSFGNLTGSSGNFINPFRYTAREFDLETGLYEYRARYYDQTSGRFVAEDPIVFRGGDTNLYRYVWNSPTSFTDPIGEWGVGVSGSASVEGGAVAAGAGVTGSVGGGVFYGKNCGCSNGGSKISTGGFASGGAFAGGPGWGAAAPSQPSKNNWAFGAYAGGGANVWVSNANNVCDLGGPFKTFSINAAWGIKMFSFQFSIGKNAAGQTIWVGNYGGPLGPYPTGGGFGGSVSWYNTYTKTLGCGCK